ncbi:hypothetical protein ACMZ8S_03690 [Gardnerella pickettii]|uniref:Uncharacterized protein n=1 Tax=Gardnerella pickettii JCP8017A TaxID=1261062 RepID=T2PIE9_9BIFI|nr:MULTISPECIES: hypothetical protein [Gardnerella]EIK82824.1 hypothetical protein CGSMWGv00703Bmash_05272 [Gardnerella pickettii 00703Bmash]EPI49254.1 hypothetical protein HMPREF1577_01509 [Gardnerella pickettii JCP8017A]MDK6471541.1 hypothetical protein [Bifidobacterium sp. UMB9259]MDK7189149.1 hypothetical protein [Bifidobacterium sp. UMB1230]EIK86311.1 hypothetical protein CGSMWGv00703C2mash_01999 [Gardnerella pickettii 00703C2mash]
MTSRALCSSKSSIRREKSRISTLLGGVMYAKNVVIRVNKRFD